ncbi:hypothetical protein PROFUN_12364 [Planoprotostelium fungivorum]|uniref:Uncharacterized protein n=1 Tax=Planoprotostelium fungivorum TaxID=1890364 RepID=A0A2P6N7E4_9EUKA|nr:hypothetical protein PROFUN_12364 [Planoprotostelium fungivorum]
MTQTRNDTNAVRTCRDVQFCVSVLSCKFRVGLAKKCCDPSLSRLANFAGRDETQTKTETSIMGKEEKEEKKECVIKGLSHT